MNFLYPVYPKIDLDKIKGFIFWTLVARLKISIFAYVGGFHQFWLKNEHLYLLILQNSRLRQLILICCFSLEKSDEIVVK